MKQLITRSLLVIAILVSAYFVGFSIKVSADSVDELSQQLLDKQAEIAKLEQKLSETRSQEKTLKSQLSIIDGQTKITQLKIEETNLKIEKLKREITDLSGRIDRLSSTVDAISEVLLKRIVQTYKYSSIGTIDLLFSSHGFADMVERLKYIQVAQANDKKVLYQLQATKAAYHDQKQDKETKQVEAEKLNKDLESYQVQLAQQKKDKDELLKVTKNDEDRYQQEITRLRADANAILAAISNVGAKISDVSKGDIIAFEGNTGCVSPPPPDGYHLHFEVYKDAKVESGAIVDKDSGEYIQFRYSSHLINPHIYLDNSSWAKPLDVYPNNITTEFGENSVFGTPHTGVDIAGSPGAPIHAVDNGTAYAAGGSVCDEPMGYKTGTTYAAKGRIIDHHNGIVTLYWHTTN